MVKVWTGTAWVEKPLKTWDGSQWKTRPTKIWDGSQWKQVPAATQPTDAWTNRASGITGLNGTKIFVSGSPGFSFGFTPTAGRLLVLLVTGTGTHTASTGWTKGPAPKEGSYNELTLFTRVADGGADDTITLTGQYSNYTINWAIFEFPATATLTNSVGVSGAPTTFPALALPGTPQFVVAAFSVRVTSAVGGDCTVSSPWVEYADLINTAPSLYGQYLYVLYQPGVTETSITPVFAFGLTGANSISQKLVVAISP